MNDNEQAAIDYSNKIHKLGRITTLMVIIALVSVPVLLGIIFNLKVDFGATFAAFLACFALFGPAGAVEFFSFAPIFGAGGQYLAFITGNIQNMKLPAAISNVASSGYENGSPEADVISTIAVGVSSLVTMAILILGLIMGSFLLPFLQSPVLAPAFNNLMPAIMGALAIPRFFSNPRGAVGPCLLSVVLLLTLGRPWYMKYNTYLIPVFLITAIAWSYVLYKMDEKKKIH